MARPAVISDDGVDLLAPAVCFVECHCGSPVVVRQVIAVCLPQVNTCRSSGGASEGLQVILVPAIVRHMEADMGSAGRRKMNHKLANGFEAQKVGGLYEVYKNGEFYFSTARLKFAKDFAKNKGAYK